MSSPTLDSIQRLVWTSLLAALIAVGAFLQISIGPIPLSMQSFFVLLAGFVLGPVRGGLAVALYLVAGLIGLPVFSGGTSGLPKLLGPTGGFLFAFLPSAMLAGVATQDRTRPLGWARGILWGGLATAVLFAVGVPWLQTALGVGWGEALALGCLPFLPGAVFKLVTVIVLHRHLHKRKLLPP